MNEKAKARASLRKALGCGFEPSRIESKYSEPTVGADELNKIVNQSEDN